MIEASVIASPILGILYYLLHAIVSLGHIWSYLIYQIQCLIISSGLLSKYQNLKLDRLKHLAVVIDSEEAKNKNKVHQLLLWLSDTGVKYVILYDIEGNKFISPTFDFIHWVTIIFPLVLANAQCWSTGNSVDWIILSE